MARGRRCGGSQELCDDDCHTTPFRRVADHGDSHRVAEQNQLTAGDAVSLSVDGYLLTVQPLRKLARFDAAVLLAETPEEYLSLPEWENMPPVGQEAG